MHRRTRPAKSRARLDINGHTVRPLVPVAADPILHNDAAPA
jgi:hypothetical protein